MIEMKISLFLNFVLNTLNLFKAISVDKRHVDHSLSYYRDHSNLSI